VLAVAEIEALSDEPPVPSDPVVPPQAVNNTVVDSILTKSTPIKLKPFKNSLPGKNYPDSYTEEADVVKKSGVIPEETHCTGCSKPKCNIYGG